MLTIRGGYAAIVGLALTFECSVIGLGQAASPPSETPTIHVTTDLIEVPVLSLKPPFQPVSGLNRSNFTIRLDGGPAFHPSYVRRQGNEPLSLSMLVDAEASEQWHLSTALQTAIGNVPSDLLHDTDRLSFFVSGCRLVRSLYNAPANLNHDRETIVHAAADSNFKMAFDGEKSCQRPAVDKVLETVISQFAADAKWKVLLIIESGERPMEARSLQEVQGIAAVRGVTIFAIKYLREGSFPSSIYSATEGLNLLVGSLGGVSIHSSFEDLGAVIETVLSIIRQRYILSFPRPGNGSSGAHRLEIRSNVKGVIVRSSAASAPLLDTTLCTGADRSWLCTEQRPKYGSSKPPE
jgi:hypothetical protein